MARIQKIALSEQQEGNWASSSPYDSQPQLTTWKPPRWAKKAGRDNTVGHVTIAPSMDNVGKCLFQLFVAGEIQGMGRAGPCGCDVQSPHGSPDPFGPHDPPQGLQHIPVASSRFRLQALHPSLPAQGGEQVRDTWVFIKKAQPSQLSQPAALLIFTDVQHLNLYMASTAHPLPVCLQVTLADVYRSVNFFCIAQWTAAPI